MYWDVYLLPYLALVCPNMIPICRYSYASERGDVPQAPHIARSRKDGQGHRLVQQPSSGRWVHKDLLGVAVCSLHVCPTRDGGGADRDGVSRWLRLCLYVKVEGGSIRRKDGSNANPRLPRPPRVFRHL